MRILYISQYFPPEMGAPAARVHELARAHCGNPRLQKALASHMEVIRWAQRAISNSGSEAPSRKLNAERA